MRIVSLEGTNFKGINEVVKLEPLQLITGPCGSNKSAIRQMLEFVVLGEITTFKNNKAEHLWKLSSDKNNEYMSVELTTDTNFRFKRIIKRSVKTTKEGVKVSCKMSFECTPSKGESKKDEFENRLKEELGLNKLMFSLDSFTNDSPAKKKLYVMQLGGFTFDGLDNDYVENFISDGLLSEKLEEVDSKKYNVFREVVTDVMDRYSYELSFEDNVTAQLNYAVAKEVEYRDEKKRCEGAASKLTQIKNELDETDRGLEEAADSLEKERDVLITQERYEQQNNSNIEQNVNTQKSIDELEENIKKYQDKKNPDDVEALEKQVRDFVIPEVYKKHDYSGDLSEIESLIQAEETKLSNHLKASEKVDKEIKAAKKSIDDFKKSCPNYSFDISNKNNKVAIIKANIKKLTEGKCPLVENIKCTTDFSPFIESMNNDIDKLEKEIYSLEKKESDNESKIIEMESNIPENEYTNLIIRVEDDIKRLEKSKSDIEDKQKSENDKYNQSIKDISAEKEKLSDLKDKLSTARSFEQRRDTYINTQKTSLEKIKKDGFLEVEAVVDVADAITATKETIKNLENQIEAKKEARINLQNQQNSIGDLKDAEMRLIAYRHIKNALGIEGIMGEVLRKGLEPIRESINNNLRLFNVEEEFFFDTTGTGKTASFDYGLVRDMNISYTTLSNGERMKLDTAIVAAFIEKFEGVNCKLITVDDINHMDREFLHDYLKGLEKMNLDNILVTGTVTDRINEKTVSAGAIRETIPKELYCFDVMVMN